MMRGRHYLATSFAAATLALAAVAEGQGAERPPSSAVAGPATTKPAPDPKETARVLANRAADAIARGEQLQAEELLRKAYAAYPAPTIAVLHARTLVHLQRFAEAASVYERATLTSLSSDSPPVFFRAIEQARKEANELRPRIPRLQIVVRGPAAISPKLALWLDGQPLPREQRGRWMLVDPGRRVVRAALSGGESEQVVRLEERQAVVVEVSNPPSDSPGYTALSWSAIGLGVAGIGAGVLSGVIATSAHRHAVDVCPDGRCAEGSVGADEYSRFREFRTISSVAYVAGAVGLGIGGYLLVSRAVDGPTLELALEQREAIVGWRGTL
jgi:hypothetical protein